MKIAILNIILLRKSHINMRFQEKAIPLHSHHGRYMNENSDFKDHFIKEKPYKHALPRKGNYVAPPSWVLLEAI